MSRFREVAERVWADALRALDALREMDPDMPDEDYSHPAVPMVPRIQRLRFGVPRSAAGKLSLESDASEVSTVKSGRDRAVFPAPEFPGGNAE